MALNGKMQAYAEARATGLKPLQAAAQAGYSGAGIRVTTTRLENRADVQGEIRRLKRGGKPEAQEAEATDNGELDRWAMKDHYATPLDLLRDVWNNPKAPKSLRYQAAKDAMPYCHARMEAGKKQEKNDNAKKASGGKYQTANKPSHLRAVN